jgi:hypothetical protein
VIGRAALVAAALLCGAYGAQVETPQAADGRYLVYTRALGTSRQAVWIGDVEGRRMRRLARGAYGLVSPDGTTVAVSRRSGIFAIRPDGRGGRLVTRGRPFAWLPDSRHLLALQGKALVSVDVQDGSIDVIERREVVSWSSSPDGGSIAYDVYRQSPPSGECQFDIYTARIDASSKTRLTRGGRSSHPVWGRSSIAFAYRPLGTGCYKPRVWRMAPDGGNKTPIMRRLPSRFAYSGYYGVRPYAWVPGRASLLATVPTEWGNELAFVDTRDGRTRKADLDARPRSHKPMYVDHASRDSRHVLGAECLPERPCKIRIYSVLDARSTTIATGPKYPHWNR